MAEIQFVAGPTEGGQTPAEFKASVDVKLAAIGAGVNINVIPTAGGMVILSGDGVGVGVLSGAKKTNVADVDYTALVTDSVIAYTSLTAARVVTLPTVASTGATATNIFALTIKDEAGAATGAETITVDGNGGETVDGAASVVINLDYGFAEVYTDGTEWFTLASRLA